MISEYHVNLILQKMDKIIERQDKILEVVKSAVETKVECSAPVERLEITLPELKAEPPKPKSTAGYKQAYALYKSSGGKLNWNQWLKCGRPGFSLEG